MLEPVVSLQPASPLSPPLSPPPQHLVGLQPAIILALTLVTNLEWEFKSISGGIGGHEGKEGFHGSYSYMVEASNKPSQGLVFTSAVSIVPIYVKVPLNSSSNV